MTWRSTFLPAVTSSDRFKPGPPRLASVHGTAASRWVVAAWLLFPIYHSLAPHSIFSQHPSSWIQPFWPFPLLSISCPTTQPHSAPASASRPGALSQLFQIRLFSVPFVLSTAAFGLSLLQQRSPHTCRITLPPSSRPPDLSKKTRLPPH